MEQEANPKVAEPEASMTDDQLVKLLPWDEDVVQLLIAYYTFIVFSFLEH